MHKIVYYILCESRCCQWVPIDIQQQWSPVI